MENVTEHLAYTLRARRRRLGLTLESLAHRCGVSRAMISAVERREKSPTIHVLCRIAAGLACTVSELIGEHAAGRVHVVRATERPSFRDESSGVERQVLSTALIESGLEMVSYTVPPGQEAGPFPPEALGSVEHITVVEGAMELCFGDERLRLEAGDSVTYRLEESVSYRSVGGKTCRLLLLIDKSDYRRQSPVAGARLETERREPS